MKNLKDLLANEKRKIEAAEAMRKDLRALTLSEKSFQLDQWKLSGLSTVYYLPNWISPGTTFSLLCCGLIQVVVSSVSRIELSRVS